MMPKRRKYKVTFYKTPSVTGADLADLYRCDVQLAYPPKNDKDLPWVLGLHIAERLGGGIQVETYKEIAEQSA
jgi:hypothetical protein